MTYLEICGSGMIANLLFRLIFRGIELLNEGVNDDGIQVSRNAFSGIIGIVTIICLIAKFATES